MKSLVFVLGWILGSAIGFAAQGETSADATEAPTLILEAPSEAEQDLENPVVLSETDEIKAQDALTGETSEPVAEASIPLFTKPAESQAKSLGGREVTFLTLAIAFILMVGGFVLMRRWVRKKVGKGSPLQIKIIGQHYIGPKKSLAVVRVAGESILIGITDHNISCIKALSLLDEELPAPDEKNSFSDSLKNQTDASFAEDDGENFSIAALTDIKDRVSTKLRDLKELN